jgi:hypothetical protein
MTFVQSQSKKGLNVFFFANNLVFKGKSAITFEIAPSVLAAISRIPCIKDIAQELITGDPSEFHSGLTLLLKQEGC